MTSSRLTQVGRVISDRMKKTVIVQVERRVQDPKYKKYVRRRTKLYVHDEREECEVGDRVEVIQTRPLSRLKRWRYLRKL